MQSQRYIDDILKEFHEQKKLINDQLQQIEPMAAQLRKPAATRYLSAGWLLLLEWGSYLLALGLIALIFFQSKLYPFYLLPEMAATQEVTDVMGQTNIENLSWYVKGMLLLLALLFFIVARNCNALRKKNAILNAAGKNIKSMVSPLLARKAAMETLDHRYATETFSTPPSASHHTVAPPSPPYSTGEEPNPAY